LSDDQRAQIAEEERYNKLLSELKKSPHYQEHFEKQKREEEHIRRELGAVAFELAQIPHAATTGYLLHELSIIDRIDGMIDRCLKRLLLVRGVKSVSASLSTSTKRIGAS
jgi:hypothetical protein